MKEALRIEVLCQDQFVCSGIITSWPSLLKLLLAHKRDFWWAFGRSLPRPLPEYSVTFWRVQISKVRG